jgi:type I restriction enzyme M protein
MNRMVANFAGYDISPDMVRLSRVNMYLHGFSKPPISEYDTLTSLEKWDDTYDVIFANPPFMTPKGGIIPHNRYRISAKRSEVLFVDYIAEHLNPTGRAAVIVPEGIVFQSATAYKNLRRYLVDGDLLYAVISLPAGVFNPYSGVKTSILLMDRTLAKERDSILFVKLNNDGFDLGAQRREIKGGEIPDVISVVQDYQKGVDVKSRENVTIAKKTDITAQDYILVGERYKEHIVADTKWPMVSLDDLCVEIRNGVNVEQIESIGKYRVTRIQTIANGTVDLSKTKWTNDEPSENFFMQSGDILLSHINSYEQLAKSAIFPTVNERVVHGINLIRFRPNTALVFPEYLSACIKSERFVTEAKSYAQRAVNQASIKTSDLRAIEVPLPPLFVQEEIIAEIDGYQKIIDGAKQIVDNYKPTIKIDPAWEMVKLGDVCEIYNGSTPSKTVGEYWNSKDVPWFTVDDIRQQGRIINSTEKHISSKALSETSVKLLPVNTVLLCCTASVGEYAITKIPLTTNQQFNGLVIKNSFINRIIPEYLFYYASNFESSLKPLGGQTAFKFVSIRDVKTILISLPPIDLQREIVARINEEMTIVEQNKRLIEIFQQKIKDKIADVWGQ